MIPKATLLEKLSQLEQQIAQLKHLIETVEETSKPPKSKHASLHGKFPQLKALTEAEIDEATQSWDKQIEKALHEF